MNIMPTVVVPPRAPHDQIVRPNLDAKISAIDASRVTTVFAPAGFGKTMAVLQWASALEQRGRPVLWLAARAGIASYDLFVAALRAACAAHGLDWKCAVDTSLAHDQLQADLVTSFATMIASCPTRPLLVIDDAQVLPTEVFEFLNAVVSGARDAMTTIIVSRSLNAVPIARLRAQGYLFEVGWADLRFSIEEATALVSCVGKVPLSEDEIDVVVGDTQGWPAGITMTRLIQDREMRDGEARFIRPSELRREFESYFSEEVMSREPLEVRNFLASTVILDEMTHDVCAALTGDDNSRSMLERVEESGLFVRAEDLDRSIYRYHPLFRQMVLRRLIDRDPARAAELRRRASRHFAANGAYLKAIEHARLSGDLEFFADMLDLLADPLTYSGQLELIDTLVTRLPSGIFTRRPHLALAIAWRRVRSLAFEAAETLIDIARAEYLRRVEAGYDPIDLQRLELAIEHRDLMLAAGRDDMRAIESRAEILLRKFGDNEPYLSCTLLAQLMASRRELYHFNDILRLEAESRRALARPGSEFAAIALKTSIAPTLAAQGKTDVAETMLEEALAYARQIGKPGVAALPALPLAEILYDRGDSVRARALVEELLPVAHEWGFADQILAGHLIKARLLFNDGDIVGAEKVLKELQVLAIECGLSRMRASAISEQVRILIRTGDAKQARDLMEVSNLWPTAEPYPTLNPSRYHESIATAVIRIEMHGHRLIQARKIAKRWCEFVRRNGAVRSGVTFELLLAEIAILGGDRSEARRAVREAVTLAAPHGWTQVFLDEGEAIQTILKEAYGQGPLIDSVPDRFGQNLVAAMQSAIEMEADDDTDGEYGLSGRLMSREIDILRMVGGGLRNREIGERLGLTEGTVKWYMQQIYDKLGVRRRPQAVIRARQLGVLA
jgi:LuxR family maltose regulon positive regulatory protein